jgi:hypothetical protein
MDDLQQEMLFNDIYVAFGAIAAVYVAMIVITGSFFLATTGLLQILLSFPVTFFFYSVVYGYDELEILPLVTIFVVLGIGADDIFVMVDNWKASKGEILKDSVKAHLNHIGATTELEMRFLWCFMQSLTAMLVTSVSQQ